MICLCLSAIPTVAQVNISGTVVDTLGRPIAGAVVQLVHQNMTDTSAANGKFSFVKSTPIIAKPVVASNGIVLNGDRLTLSLAKSQHVAVDLFNAKGALLSHVMTRNLTAGSHNVTIEADRFGTGIMFVKVLRDGEAETFRFNSVGTNHYSAGLAGDNENATALAKVNALTGDTLTCWKSGFIQARTAISSLSSRQSLTH